MRLFKAVLVFAALTAALPPEKGATGEPKGPKPAPDKLPLEVKIDSQEKERRTVNLSPRNNPREGLLLPRACSPSSSCPCVISAIGLYCGYCDAMYECQSGECLNEVFQCGPERGSQCCSYGYRTSCASRQGPCGD